MGPKTVAEAPQMLPRRLMRLTQTVPQPLRIRAVALHLRHHQPIQLGGQHRRELRRIDAHQDPQGSQEHRRLLVELITADTGPDQHLPGVLIGVDEPPALHARQGLPKRAHSRDPVAVAHRLAPASEVDRLNPRRVDATLAVEHLKQQLVEHRLRAEVLIRPLREQVLRELTGRHATSSRNSSSTSVASSWSINWDCQQACFHL